MSDEPGTVEGRFVVPGTYQLRLTVGDKVHTRPLDVRLDPAITVPAADIAQWEALASRQATLLGAAYRGRKAIEASLAQTGAVLSALKSANADTALVAQAQAAADEARRLHILLNGEEEGIAQQETFLPLYELALRLYTSTQGYTAAPDQAQRRLTDAAQQRTVTFYRDLGVLLSERLPALQKATTGAGIAWPAAQRPALPANPFASAP